MALPRRRHPESDYGNLGGSTYQIIGAGGDTTTPCDYIIYQESGIIKALNGTTRVIDFFGADASTVINQAIAACGYTAHIYVKPGTYTLTTSIVSGDKTVIFEGAGTGALGAFTTMNPGTLFRPDAAFTTDFLFKFGAADHWTYHSCIRNIIIDGRSYATQPGAIEWRNICCGRIEDVAILNFRDTATPGRGITMTGNAGYGGYWNQLNNLIVHDCVQGVYFNHLYANATMLYGGYFRNSVDNPAYGLLFYGTCDTCSIIGTDFSFYNEALSSAVKIQTDGGNHKFTNCRFEGNTTDVTIDAGAGSSFFVNCNIPGTIVDNSAYPSQFIGCKLYYTIRRGYTAISDGGTIAHGLDVTPVGAVVTGSVANEILAVTALSAANITVAIKKRADGSAGTNQVVYWIAYGSGSRY